MSSSSDESVQSSQSPKKTAKTIKTKDSATPSTSNAPVQDGKKKRATTKGDRDEDREYTETEKQKDTKSATACGDNILKKVKKFADYPNTRYYIKLQYMGDKCKKKWDHGKDFLFWDEDLEKAPLPSKQEVQSVIRETIQEEFQNQRGDSGSPSLGTFSSPRRRTVPAKKDKCSFCKKDLDDDLAIVCSNEDDDGAECQMGVHVSCLGFKKMKKKNVEKLPEWFCPLHREDDAENSQNKEKSKKKQGKK